MPSFLAIIRSKIPRHFSQVMATLAVSLGPFAAGLGKGYSSPALASLQESKTTNFHVSAQEGSWVASLSLLGAMVGCLVGGFLLQVGRKRSLLIVALPFSGSWLLTVFAQRVEMLYGSSFIAGFFSAVTLLTTQVYVSEISHPEIRGCLSAILKMAGDIGTLASFSLGAFLDWRQLATVAAGGPILFFFAILLIPETPSYLLYNGREEEACKAMAWLRSSEDDVTSEIETLRSNIMTKCKSIFPRFTNQFPFRELFITCGLMFFQKFSGVTVFHHYAVPIFKQVFGRSINPHGAAIVVVLLRLLGSMTSGLLIDTVGRLPLLIISNLFISGSFFGFGLYNWMEESLPPNYPGFGPSLDWIPLTCVLFFTFFFSIGIGPISWLMVSELFPLEYRGFGGAISTSFSYACAFAAVKTYVDIRSQVGLYGAFWIYSAIAIVGLFFVCCAVPETKGVQLEEMHPETIIPPTSTLPQQNSSTTDNNQSNSYNCTGINCLRPSTRHTYCESKYPSTLRIPPGVQLPTFPIQPQHEHETKQKPPPNICMNLTKTKHVPNFQPVMKPSYNFQPSSNVDLLGGLRHSSTVGAYDDKGTGTQKMYQSLQLHSYENPYNLRQYSNYQPRRRDFTSEEEEFEDQHQPMNLLNNYAPLQPQECVVSFPNRRFKTTQFQHYYRPISYTEQDNNFLEFRPYHHHQHHNEYLQYVTRDFRSRSTTGTIV